MLEVVNQLPQVLVGEHGRHGSRDGPEQVGADPGIECTPALFVKNGPTCANDTGVPGSIGHSV